MSTARRIVLPLLLLIFLGILADRAAIPATSRPSFVLILTDDQDLVLGSLDFMPKTRALIARQGITFSNHFVPLSLCCPSRSTILTGLHVHNHQVLTNFLPTGGFERFDALGHEKATLAAALHAAGYRTALIGKYLNGYPHGKDLTYVPPGWDEWVSPVQGSPYAAYRYTLNENGKLVFHGSRPEDYMTDVLAAKATAFVRRSAAEGKPFFLYLATYAPHKPSIPAKRHAGLFPGLQAPRTPSFNEIDARDKPARIRALKRLDARQIAALDTLYRKQMQSLQAVDEAVAALVQTLQETGRLDDTYILFTSDNGFHMGQHRLDAGKYTPYEPDVHVPLLLRGPGVPAGITVQALTSSVDFAPTLADLAGVALKVEPDGRSLVPLLQGEVPEDWRQMVLLEQFAVPPGPPGSSAILEPANAGDKKGYPAHQGLRTADLKLVAYDTGEREVYDLRKDPDERINLRDRVPRSWLTRLVKLARTLGSCAGESCREIEAWPAPGLP